MRIRLATLQRFHTKKVVKLKKTGVKKHHYLGRRFNTTSINNNNAIATQSEFLKLEEDIKMEMDRLLLKQKGRKKDFVDNYFANKSQVHSNQIFPTTRDINLANMDLIGFDYDFTIANYCEDVKNLLYDLALGILVNQFKYPQGLLKSKYDPNFSIKGLYYDMKKGYIMKLDYLQNIQVDTVYLGRTRVSTEEIIRQYGGVHIGSNYSNKNLRLLADSFQLPEACLMADVIDHFQKHGMSYDPTYIFADIAKVFFQVHKTEIFHKMVLEKLSHYLPERRPKLVQFLAKLRRKKKKIFLLTNSSFYFVDAGLKHLFDGISPEYPHWNLLFDYIIVNAEKPNWFVSSSPFRKLDTEKGTVLWGKIDRLDPHNVYVGGSLKEFANLTEIKGSQILYIGDHLSFDVKQPNESQGWRTAIIISELGREIEIQSTKEHEEALKKLLKLLEYQRDLEMLSKEKQTIILIQLRKQIQALREYLKCDFNPYFGSVFRTHSNPSLFAYELQRYADVYTSNIENFDNYPHDYIFSSGWNYLPHEQKLE